MKLKKAKKKPNSQIYFSRPSKKIKSQIRVIWPQKGQTGNPNNNTGNVCGDEYLDMCQKAQCFVHYTYERSEKQLMVLHIQGCDYTLFDPEVASKEASSDGEYLFCAGNLYNAIEVFTEVYICNQFCTLLGVTNLKQSDS